MCAQGEGLFVIRSMPLLRPAGAVYESRQASNSSTYQNIRAHGGDLDIKYTKIVSWDLLAADYDYDLDDGRR